MGEDLNMQVWSPVLREEAVSGTRAETIGESGGALMRANLSDDVTLLPSTKGREPVGLQQHRAELRVGGTPRINTLKVNQRKDPRAGKVPVYG